MSREFSLLSILTLLVCANWGFAIESIALPSRAHSCPDGTKTVRVVAGDSSLPAYEIKDNLTGKTARIESRCAPIYDIAWSPDSKSIFVVAHSAREKVVIVLHQGDDCSWRSYVVRPPEKERHFYQVAEWRIKPKALEIVCVVLLERGAHGWPIYEVTFDVEPSTGSVSNVRNRRQLSYEEWARYRSRYISP